ncbi:Highly acidic elicitin 26 [Phytophthora citrophthora]|uniref:Highly acidic elicitin 26 n=1 Tax=Phytophthora citrophthora TaxID=4793 RepID=A0AAD9FYE2_9STRA|nr:Highly acidic elicitin 26 [Phytophthora citrophthora]
MKFAAVATAAALVAATNAASCDVTSLQTLLTSSDTTTCASDSGYTVTSLATPTDAEMAIMCTSTACQSVLTQLQTLAPSECTLGAFSLYADLITPLTNYCSGGSSATTTTAGSSATTATAGSSATTVTVGSTTGSTTSGTVTTSSTGSAASTPATSSGSSTSETASSSSAASASASASTSGSSGASMAAISAGAVLAAVAAAFF